MTRTLSDKIYDANRTGKNPPELDDLVDTLSGVEEGDTIASGTPVAHIDDPADGVTVDAEARAAINDILDALEAFKIAATS